METPDDSARGQQEQGASFFDAASPPSIPDSSNAIAEAFAGLDRNPEHRIARPSILIGRVGIACALFVLAAFGGGLSLARFSFNTPLQPISVAPPAPEMIYQPPEVAAASWIDLRGRAAAAEADASSKGLPAKAVIAPSDLPEGGRVASMDPSDPVPPEVSRANLNLQELSTVCADAMRFAATGFNRQGSVQNGDPLQFGYEAVEIAPIPEASTGMLVALAMIGLLVFGQRRTRIES